MSLNGSEKETLLKLARAAIQSHVAGKTAEDVDIEDPEETLLQDSGAFVSIHKNGRLRGCIGVFSSPNPLYKTVMDMAVAACSSDPRFEPVRPEELVLLDIEVSVLSPLKEISDTSEIEIGRHGLYITKGRNRGVLLPQVAVEHGFDRDTFLDQTCLKAGLPAGAWKDGATVFTFEAEIIKESDEV